MAVARKRQVAVVDAVFTLIVAVLTTAQVVSIESKSGEMTAAVPSSAGNVLSNSSSRYAVAEKPSSISIPSIERKAAKSLTTATTTSKVAAVTTKMELQAPQRAHTPETDRESHATNIASEKIAAPSSDDKPNTVSNNSTGTASNGMTREQLEIANQEMKELLATSRSSITDKTKENNRLFDQIAAQESTIANLQAQIDDKSREATAQSAAKANMIAEMQRQIDENLEEARNYKSERDSKQQEIDRLKLLIANRTSDVQRLDAERSSLQSEKQSLMDDVNSKTSVIKNLRDELSERSKDITGLRESVAEKTKLHAKLKKEQQDLRQNHLYLHEEHRKLEAQYADPSVQHFLRAKAVKVYSDPGIEGAANKTFIYVLPTLKDRYVKGKKFLNDGEAALVSKLNAYVGNEKVEPWLPAISGCLVYGTVLVPFICTVCCLTRIVCKLRPLLLFCHVDFLLTSLCAGLFAAYSGKEPLAAFAHHDASVYLFTQAVFAFVFCLYAACLVVAYCLSSSGTGEACYRCIQIIGVTPVACIYYINVWTPAMMDEMPHMDQLVALMVGEGTAVSGYSWLPYVPVSVNFLVLLELERLCWNSGRSAKEKEADKMTIVMRDDVELATLIPNVGEDRLTASKKA